MGAGAGLRGSGLRCRCRLCCRRRCALLRSLVRRRRLRPRSRVLRRGGFRFWRRLRSRRRLCCRRWCALLWTLVRRRRLRPRSRFRLWRRCRSRWLRTIVRLRRGRTIRLRLRRFGLVGFGRAGAGVGARLGCAGGGGCFAGGGGRDDSSADSLALAVRVLLPAAQASPRVDRVSAHSRRVAQQAAGLHAASPVLLEELLSPSGVPPLMRLDATPSLRS